jgi:hypothetical protein
MSASQKDTTREGKDHRYSSSSLCNYLPVAFATLLSSSSLASVCGRRTEKRPSLYLLIPSEGTNSTQYSPRYPSKLSNAKVEEERGKRGFRVGVDDPAGTIGAEDMDAQRLCCEALS